MARKGKLSDDERIAYARVSSAFLKYLVRKIPSEPAPPSDPIPHNEPQQRRVSASGYVWR